MAILSAVSDETTARTNLEVCRQRAENLASLGVKSVLELCVGPSLQDLEKAYAKHGISCIGNDLDERWKSYYSRGSWRMGDCFAVDWTGVDAVVFAPPLSRGCTGKREDALRIDDVEPSYHNFLWCWHRRQYDPKVAVLVLPGRSLATKEDRSQFWSLKNLADINGKASHVEMIDGCRKYVDIYIGPFDP